MFTEKKTCRLCDGTKLERVLSLPPTPPANAFQKEAGPVETIPLDLNLCRDCGHLQLGVVVDPGVLFGDYKYVSPPGMQPHWKAYAAAVDNQLAVADRFVVEIGSNNGSLLAEFQKLGARVLGFEPALEIAKAASDSGVRTVSEFFNRIAVKHCLELLRDQPHVVVANNVLAHIDDLKNVVATVSEIIAPGGLFVFEVQWRKTLVADNLFDMCLPPNEPVMTRDGWKAIGKIREGDQVLTHRGRFKAVKKTFRRQYAGNLVEIHPYGADAPIRVTPEHPIYVRRGLGEFVAAKDVTTADVVIKPAIGDREKLPWLHITSRAPGRVEQLVTTKFRVGRDLARVLGYYIAEGFYTTVGKSVGKDSACVEFAFGKSRKERGLANDCAKRLRRLGSSARVRWTKFGWHVWTYGPMARLLCSECGTGAANKRMPRWAFTIGDGITEEMLYGYVLGDGYVYRDGRYWRAGTVSTQLAREVALLANKLGWACSINRSKQVWAAKIIANNPRPTESVLPLYDILIRRQPKKASKVYVEDAYQHGKVRKVESVPYNGDVCNLEVDEDHTYVTPGGAVHNCYHEHLDYHALTSLVPMLRRAGFREIDAEIVATHGGSLRVYARQGPHGALSITDRAFKLMDEESDHGLFATATYHRWRVRIDAAKDGFVGAIKQREWGKLNGGGEALRIAAYGAPAKATTLLWTFGMQGLPAYVVDDSAWKQGLYLPGTAVPVVSFDRLIADPPDVLLVLAWNFATSIIDKVTTAFLAKGVKPPVCLVPMKVNE